MDRRSFFKRLGALSATAAIAPKVAESFNWKSFDGVAKTEDWIYVHPPQNGVITSFNDYGQFVAPAMADVLRDGSYRYRLDVGLRRLTDDNT